MKKLSALFLFLLPTVLFAQFSERESDSTIYRLGCRPNKGYKVLTLSLDPVAVFDKQNSFYEKSGLTTGSLVFGRYFIKDNVAARLGVRLYKNGKTSKGEVDVNFTGNNISGREMRDAVSEFILVPGVEKHFAYTNMFDFYIAGDLYLGYGKSTRIENTNYSNGFYDHEKRTTPKYLMGAGAVMGMNVFVLDLPISIGLEYGINAIYNLSTKTKVVQNTNDALGERNNTYYTQEEDPFGNPDNTKYSSLKSSGSSINTANNFRINVNFYFR